MGAVLRRDGGTDESMFPQFGIRPIILTTAIGDRVVSVRQSRELSGFNGIGIGARPAGLLLVTRLTGVKHLPPMCAGLLGGFGIGIRCRVQESSWQRAASPMP